MNINELIQEINTNLPDNTTQAITAAKLRTTLIDMLYNGVGDVYDISANHNNARYANLASAIGVNGDNIPDDVRKGGMSIKYINTSGQYEQWIYLGTATTNASISNVQIWRGITDIFKDYRIAGFIGPNNSYLMQAKEGTCYICTTPNSNSWYIPSGQTEGAAGACYLPPTSWVPSGEGNLPSSITGWTYVSLATTEYKDTPVLFGFKNGTWVTHRLPYALKSSVDVLENIITGGPTNWDSTYDGQYLNANGEIVNNNAYISERKRLINGHTYSVTQRTADDPPAFIRLYRVDRSTEDVVYTQVQNWRSETIEVECPNDNNEYLLQTSFRKNFGASAIIVDLNALTQSLVYRVEQLEAQDMTIDPEPVKDSENAVSSNGVFDQVNYYANENLYIFPEQATGEVYGVPNASFNQFVDTDGNYSTTSGWSSTRIALTASHTYKFLFQHKTNGIYVRIFRITGTADNYTWELVQSYNGSHTFEWEYTCPNDGNIYVAQMARYTNLNGLNEIYDITDQLYTTIKEKIDDIEQDEGIDIKASGLREEGYYIYSTGEKMQQSSSTDSILYTFDVQNMLKLKVYAAAGGTATWGIYVVAFYSSETPTRQTFISGKLHYGTATDAHWYEVEVPNDAVIGCVTINKQKISEEDLVVKGVYDGLKISNNISEINEKIDEIIDGRYEKHLNICVLGNSYTCDTFMYVPFILQQYGITCTMHLYYRGSGSIDTLINEWTDSSSSSDGHSRQHFYIDTTTMNAWVTETRLSSKQMVEIRNDWNMIVTTNQSTASLYPSSFTNVDQLVQLINASMPNPYILCYQIAYTRKANDNPTLSLATQTSEIKKHAFAEVFPVGTAVFNARQNATLAALGNSGDLWVDNVHLQDGIPCYIAALTVVEKIFRMYGMDHSVLQDQLRPTEEWCVAHKIKDRQGGESCGLTANDNVTLNCYLAQKAAIVAVNNPSEIIAI